MFYYIYPEIAYKNQKQVAKAEKVQIPMIEEQPMEVK